MDFRHSNNPFHESPILEVPFLVNAFKCHSTLFIGTWIGTHGLPNIAYTPSSLAQGLAALVLCMGAYISGKSFVPMHVTTIYYILLIIYCTYNYVSLYVGGSKAFAGQYILYCPASRAI